MSSIQERKFYLQLWNFTTGPAIKVMKLFFEVKILTNITFETFLNDQNNMHILFHQLFPTIPCCKCKIKSLASSKKRGCLISKQFDILYDKSGLPQPSHEHIRGSQINQHCICKFSAKCSLKVSALDITLFYDIIQHCCPSKMNFTWLKSIKDTRNYLAHGHGVVEMADFEDKWKTLKTATLGFAGEMGNVCEEIFQDEIARIQNSSTAHLEEILEKSQDFIEKLRNDLNGFKPLQRTVDECKAVVDSMNRSIGASMGQSENILTEIKLNTEGVHMNTRNIGEIKHTMNKVYAIVKLLAPKEMDEEKEKNIVDENRTITVVTRVDSTNWNEENTIRNISNNVKPSINSSDDTDEFHVKNIENKCIQLELVAFPDVFKSPQNLRKTIKSFIFRLVQDGEIDTNIPGKLEINLTVISPLTRGEMAVVYTVFDKSGTLEDYVEIKADVRTSICDGIPLTQILKKDPDKFDKSNLQSKIADTDDSMVIPKVKTETADEGKYDEIFVDVGNLKCLFKLRGLPNDISQTELKERPPDIKDHQLLYVEWTLSCPTTWNRSFIASSINDNLSILQDEFHIDYVYNDTNSKLIIQTTTQRDIFRSYSTLEMAVKNLMVKIINVSGIKSTEPEELTASVLILTEPDKEEFIEAEFNKGVKTNKSKEGLKDNIVTCEHCTQVFGCKKCTSKISLIRRLKNALDMKEQTIERLDRALTKREEEMSEDSDEEKRNISTTAEKEISEEPKQKKRKTEITPYIKTLDDTRKSLNQTNSNIQVDVKQALQKLGELPLFDYSRKIYNKYIKDMNIKLLGKGYEYGLRGTIRPKNIQSILDNLTIEKKKRTKLIPKLVDVIHFQNVFTTTDDAYGTDIEFLDLEIPPMKCDNCHTDEASQLSCFCKSCGIFICNNCVIEHRMDNNNHEYTYAFSRSRDFEEAVARKCVRSELYDITYMCPDIVMILGYNQLCSYNLKGELVNTYTLESSDYSESRIACINDGKIAVAVPNENRIHIVTIVTSNATITTNDLRSSKETRMTGGISCRMDTLYVAFSDVIQLMDLSGHIQKVINIPNANILHSVNSDKMLCVSSKITSDKPVSCINFTKDKVYDFKRFPFYPEDITTDDIGNILFIADGVIWKSDSEGKGFELILIARDHDFERLTYNKDSKSLATFKKWTKYTTIQMYKKL